MDRPTTADGNQNTSVAPALLATATGRELMILRTDPLNEQSSNLDPSGASRLRWNQLARPSQREQLGCERKEYKMNKIKLKKLFGPRALAATVGTAMLLHAAIAWADNCYSEGLTLSPGCQGACSFSFGNNPPGNCINYHGQTVYWCCPSGSSCGATEGGPGFCWGWCTCGTG